MGAHRRAPFYGRKYSHAEIVERQKNLSHQRRVPINVVLNDVRSSHNVGSIFRTADGAGIEKIWLCGITGYPPNAQLAKTALGAEKKVPWEYVKDARDALRRLRALGYQIVLLEQMEESRPYQDFAPQFPLCIILGHEVEGISQEIINLCDAAIEIEMAGLKNSLNVAVAFGVVAYHFRQQFKSVNPPMGIAEKGTI